MSGSLSKIVLQSSEGTLVGICLHIYIYIHDSLSHPLHVIIIYVYIRMSVCQN